MCDNMCLEKLWRSKGGREQWLQAIVNELSRRHGAEQQARGESSVGAEANRISEMPILVDVDAIVEPSVTGESQDTPTTDAFHRHT